MLPTIIAASITRACRGRLRVRRPTPTGFDVDARDSPSPPRPECTQGQTRRVQPDPTLHRLAPRNVNRFLVVYGQRGYQEWVAGASYCAKIGSWAMLYTISMRARFGSVCVCVPVRLLTHGTIIVRASASTRPRPTSSRAAIRSIESSQNKGKNRMHGRAVISRDQ